jgi:hypothetical protein
MLTGDEEEGIREDKFTLSGFLSIVKLFIEKNQLQPPWVILRNFNYDDDLALTVPEFDKNLPSLITSDERRFLDDTFTLFSGDDDVMTSSQCQKVFAVLRDDHPVPPWHPFRSKQFFDETGFAVPSQATIDAGVSWDACDVGVGSISESTSTILAASAVASMGGSLIIGPGSPTPMSRQQQQHRQHEASANMSDSSILIPPGSMMLESAYSPPSVPTVDMTRTAWMNYWHLSKHLNAAGTAAELFKLGLTEERIALLKNGGAAPSTPATKCVRARVFGSQGSKLIGFLGGAGINGGCGEDAAETTFATVGDDAVEAFVKHEREIALSRMAPAERAKAARKAEKQDDQGGGGSSNGTTTVLLTDVPSAMVSLSSSSNSEDMDLAVIVFDSGDESSVKVALDISEKALGGKHQRVFVDVGSRGSKAMEDYVGGKELEAPLAVAEGGSCEEVLAHIVLCASRKKRTIPDEAKRKKEEFWRTFTWRAGVLLGVSGLGLGGWWGDKKMNGGKGAAWLMNSVAPWFKESVSGLVRRNTRLIMEAAGVGGGRSSGGDGGSEVTVGAE